MKKNLLLLLFVLIANSAYSQWFGGSWGYGWYSPQVYYDPCVQATIRTAQATQWVNGQMMQQQQWMYNNGYSNGYYNNPTYSSQTNRRSSNTNYSSRSSRTNNGRSYVYNCCSSVATFGQEPRYHKCSNCGVNHRIGTHKCVRNR